ncbi:MAG: DUF58 domain-containing protein [Actinomycetota bacterium]|nr:DUF58 domain-containing protein [Actinomycetota bacterium]
MPRRPLLGMSYAAMRSARRGVGSDIAGSRAYRPGDNVDNIDWAASARLSSARGVDEFIVRERHSDEAPWVVVLADRRPSMALYGDPFPWLRKWEALENAVDIVLHSALAARSMPAYLDYADGEEYWRAPRGRRDLWQGQERSRFAAPEDTLALGLERLAHHRPRLPLGSFVFVLSDFLSPPPRDAWLEAIERGWDLIPVVIQDPTWERSFPDVSGIAVPFADVSARAAGRARLTKREVSVRRTENERRHVDLLHDFEELGIDPLLLEVSDGASVHAVFIDWAERRQAERGRRW